MQSNGKLDDSKTDEPTEVLNQVKDAIKAAENKKQSDYTKETWDAYQKALTDARAVAEKARCNKRGTGNGTEGIESCRNKT